MAPFCKVGGLADAVRGLSEAQAQAGSDVTVFLPAYRHLLRGPLERLPLGPTVFTHGNDERRQHLYRLPHAPAGVRVLLLSDGEAFDRDGIYAPTDSGSGYADDADRWAVFCRGVLETLPRIDLRPDVIHAHDHAAALVPVMLRRIPRGGGFLAGVRTVLTIHNLAHQGLADPGLLDRTGLGREEFHPGGDLEFWGRVNVLKTGIIDADVVTTVSQRYAAEIRSSPEFGCGLEGVLAGRGTGLRGIRNGLDTRIWDPARDEHLASGFDAEHPGARVENRNALLRETGLEDRPGMMVAGMVTRLADQKGIDLLRAAAERLLERPLALVIIGSGDPGYVEFLDDLARRYPGRVSYTSGFNEPRAHRIYGGADVFLMPSRFEPCGIAQLIALRYGAIPVARNTGGLGETLSQVSSDGAEGTAFLFDDYTSEAFIDAVDRALELRRRDDTWERVRDRCMREVFTWDQPVAEYDKFYREIIAGPGVAG